VEKAKSDYHMACKNEKTAINQERNANADSSLSQDQVRQAFSSRFGCLFYKAEELLDRAYIRKVLVRVGQIRSAFRKFE
jgi:hypothetical protein